MDSQAVDSVLAVPDDRVLDLLWQLLRLLLLYLCCWWW